MAQIIATKPTATRAMFAMEIGVAIWRMLASFEWTDLRKKYFEICLTLGRRTFNARQKLAIYFFVNEMRRRYSAATRLFF
jgi:hypothetical protein